MSDIEWFEDAVVYQVYPLGCCGAPWEQDCQLEHRLPRLAQPAWVDHLKSLGVDCLLLNPVFASGSHGYDTSDYLTVDPRLGTNDDLRDLVATYHEAGIRVMLDGVFNHAGRGFAPFRDVLASREQSRYRDWFNISFDGDDGYGDGLWYEDWEGAGDLVKLNLGNDEVKNYLYDVVRRWVADYDIDGLRLDVAYCLDLGFLWGLRDLANEVKPGFVLMGETMFGDYNTWMGEHGCHSVTNYECYKGLWSAVANKNLPEVTYAFKRQSGTDPWCLYTGAHLFDFLENHDVDRIATKLADAPQKLAPLYGLLYGMPGIPCLYYGGEWGVEGAKLPGDHELRPAFDVPGENDLTTWLRRLGTAYHTTRALAQGGYQEVLVQPECCVFERLVDDECGRERVLVAVNIADEPVHLDFDAGCGQATDLITGELHDFGGGSDLEPCSCHFWLCER
ncbi:MAG: alpha-amylase family glycosyl hydrolase [Atopobiaceae bacterium]|jgi:glycosidase|nr:alpha-amylase family glycosyl hydrolase [Atopobiaceae bacterium]MCH4180177.1 alpha-amylase family glycosyl hydrolase [Atopobiaceae bacterium]MCH4214347.1 alpha-amylase family glycosyl hydrolase [Atopobiaceae bacterium]MCH4229222.1 alpha-amylase family glycosyl hydrolase [Atopobiaceae bacterium]MCH4276593.1 alpha-amylase family glycosyl hydrolase [Atopobiaceae bacterium]